MIFRLYARNCCFQGVVLNLKFTLINSLSSMFDQLPLYTFFFSIRTEIRACSPLEISIYILREFFFIFLFFFTFFATNNLRIIRNG